MKIFYLFVVRHLKDKEVIGFGTHHGSIVYQSNQEISGKGSHTNWRTSSIFKKNWRYIAVKRRYLRQPHSAATISGKDGSDAKVYQERETKQAIEELDRRRTDG